LRRVYSTTQQCLVYYTHLIVLVTDTLAAKFQKIFYFAFKSRYEVLHSGTGKLFNIEKIYKFVRYNINIDNVLLEQ